MDNSFCVNKAQSGKEILKTALDLWTCELFAVQQIAQFVSHEGKNQNEVTAILAEAVKEWYYVVGRRQDQNLSFAFGVMRLLHSGGRSDLESHDFALCIRGEVAPVINCGRFVDYREQTLTMIEGIVISTKCLTTWGWYIVFILQVDEFVLVLFVQWTDLFVGKV